MQNKLIDLNNHLFAQLERLSEEDLEGEKLNEEINRSKAVSAVATKIIENASLALQAEKFKDDRINANKKLPDMLEG